MLSHDDTRRRLLLWLLIWSIPAAAIGPNDKWSLVYNTPAWDALPPCAQPCVASLDASLGCSTYSCVCSGNTAGASFINGMRYIQQCVRRSCPSSGEAVVNAALAMFQEICEVRYTLIPTATAAPTATIPMPATPSPGFDVTKAVLIDEPHREYSALKPCLRWLLNACAGHGDNSGNCYPPSPAGQFEWAGLGAHLQCMTAKCMCTSSKFPYSADKLFEYANKYCGVAPLFDAQSKTGNEHWKLTIGVFAAYCSVNGYIVNEGKVLVTSVQTDVALSHDFISIIIATATSFSIIVGVLVLFIMAWRKRRRRWIDIPIHRTAIAAISLSALSDP